MIFLLLLLTVLGSGHRCGPEEGSQDWGPFGLLSSGRRFLPPQGWPALENQALSTQGPKGLQTPGVPSLWVSGR